MTGDFRVTVEYYSGRRQVSTVGDLSGVAESDRKYVVADSGGSQLVTTYHPSTDRHTAMCTAQRELLAAQPGVTVVAVRCEDA